MRKALLCLLACLSGFSVSAYAAEPLTLFINSAEGGAISGRRLNSFSHYLNLNGCPVTKVKTAAELPELLTAELVFTALKYNPGKPYQPLLKLKVLNDAALSSSILVRGSTAVTNLRALKGVRIAFLSPYSITGYQLAQDMFLKLGVEHNRDRITFTRTNVGAMSLLLHKDVFAAVIATPLAEKWRQANDLQLLGVSETVEAGGLWSKELSPAMLAACRRAFLELSDGSRSSQKLLKIFPGWLQGFTALE